MKFYKSVQFMSAAAIVAGLFVLTPISYYWIKNKVDAAHASVYVPAKAPIPKGPTVITGHPDRIVISAPHLDLQVIDGVYYPSSGIWTLTLDKAQFALPSVQPNNISGDTFIYGHYRPEVFAYLHLIQPGATATIYTTNGYKFTYIYQFSKAFDPNDTSVFLYKGLPKLTIQTCSGSFFQHRQMYYFKYDGYKKV